MRGRAAVLACLWLAACAAASGEAPRTGAPQAGSGAPASLPGTASVILPSAASPASPAPTVAGDQTCAAVSQHADNQLQPADIIFAVDNSGSMTAEIGFVREQLNAFSQRIVQSGIDVRIILISGTQGRARRGDDDDDDDEEPENGICIAAPLGSGTCPQDSLPPRYLHVPQKVGSNDALDLIVSSYPRWSAQLRPNASKTFVVVSDDDATDAPINSAAAFRQRMMSLDPLQFSRFVFSGIYCSSRCPQSAAVGSVYAQLVQETGGVAGDLCQQSFGPVFDALARAVIAGSQLDCAWQIPQPPIGQSFDPGLVNVHLSLAATGSMPLLQVSDPARCANQPGWFYDVPARPARIVACPATCQALQSASAARVDVLFGCQTQAAPE